MTFCRSHAFCRRTLIHPNPRHANKQHALTCGTLFPAFVQVDAGHIANPAPLKRLKRSTVCSLLDSGLKATQEHENETAEVRAAEIGCTAVLHAVPCQRSIAGWLCILSQVAQPFSCRACF